MSDDIFAGVETWYADGSGQLAVTDRLTRFVTKGSLHIPTLWPSGAGVRTVNVPGIKNDGTWFVTATGMCIIEIFDGYFRYTRTDMLEWYGPGSAFEKEGPYVYYTVMKL